MSPARIALIFAGLVLLSVLGAAALVGMMLIDDAWTRERLERLSDWHGIERYRAVPPGRE